MANSLAFITMFDISKKSHKQANNDKIYKKNPWILRKKIKYKKNYKIITHENLHKS
jgi:hypothetical protein